MNILSTLLLASVSAASPSVGVFKFANVISDNAVIQRDVAAPVWGFAKPGSKVSVSLNGKGVGVAVADDNGRWTVKLPVQKANKNPSTISATCAGETVSITNVLFGDVWFGCGQSNMAYTFAGYGRLPVGGEDFLQRVKDNKHVRTLLMNDKRNKNSGFLRQDALDIGWEYASYDNIRKNGAALYWMGWKLYEELDVPIGLVNASWGATKIDGWIDSEWGAANGTGRGKGISIHWKNGRDDFFKAGGIEAFNKRLYEWNKKYNPAGNWQANSPYFKAGTPTLHDVDFDDSGWKEITLPSDKGFQCAPFPTNFTGEVWLRCVFELTEEDLKKNWAIGYGDSYGQDMNYLNGKAFGGSGNPNHGYGVPIREHGKVGKNVLAVCYKVWGAGTSGKEGGIHKAVKISLWPSHERSIEMKFKAAFGEPPPCDIWNHPEARRPNNPGEVTMFSATSMHNGLVHPLYPMAIKGAVWYQGCSDLGNGKYEDLFRTLVGAWRAQFTYKDRLPVIVTEIAPHQLDTKPNSTGRIEAGETEKPTWSVNADMRRNLNEIAAKVEDCGSVSLVDLGEPDIHPIRKEEVGERYAKWALEHVYGKKIAGTCPTVASVEWKGPKCILHLKDAKGLKTSDGKSVKGFELAGPVHKGKDRTGKEKDGVRYVYCSATIKGDTIELSSPDVKTAAAFRYAWFDLNLGWNVVNGAGLPLGTCRSFADGVYHDQIED